MSMTVVLGYDGSASGERALEEAAGEVARAGGGRVIVVTAYEETSVYSTAVGLEPPFVPALPPDEQQLAQELALQLALKAEEQLTAVGIDCAHVVTPADPGDALMQAAKEHSANMLVVGGHHHGALAGIFGAGSVIRRLVHHCPVPLLVVPPPAE